MDAHAVDVETGALSISDEGAKDALRVVAVGDICPYKGSGLDRLLADPRKVGDAFGETLPLLKDKDLSVANLELPLSELGEGIIKDGPVLFGPAEALAGMEAAGFDALCMANNHVLDRGPAALLETMRRARARGFTLFGSGADEREAQEAVVVERRGARVGLMAFAENEFSVAGREAAGASAYRPGPNVMAVARARKRCDVLLVFVHGGSEFCPLPSPRMVRDYRALAEAGASAVIGGHPHTVQGLEVHEGVPILYSLGNFLFWTRKKEPDPLWHLEMLAQLEFAGGHCVGLQVHPVRSEKEEGTRVLRGQERRAFLERLNRLSAVIADPARHERLWEAYCLTRLPFYLARIAETRQGLEQAKLRAIAAAHLKNLFGCEAHHEVIITGLELVRRGAEQAEAGAQAELAELMVG